MSFAPPAEAIVVPPTVVAGPSAAILGVGNAALAPDGTGGIVWRQLSDGVPHVFVSAFRDGHWGAPTQVDTGTPGPATEPAIAAADGGELLVVWVAPWASESSGGNAPTPHYQLESAVMEPGSKGFGPAVEVDASDIGDGTGATPALAMAPDGIAYVAYRVVTNPLTPGAFEPAGTPVPMRTGDELVDVRVARFNGLAWSSLGAMNAFPGQVTMRRPTVDNAPKIVVDRAADALVAWQEPTIDGVARIWARRLFGTTKGFLLPASPQTWKGQPVTADADAPAVAINDFAGSELAFRLDGGAGSPLGVPTEFVSSLGSAFVPGSNAFAGLQPIGGGATVGPPSTAIDDTGDYQAGFASAGQTEIVTGRGTGAGSAHPVGATAGDTSLATLDPDGGGAAIWPGTDAHGLPVVEVQEIFPRGGFQQGFLSAPISGPVSTLSIGPSGQGDALIAWRQGLSSTSQVVAADVQMPPHNFYAFTPIGWVTQAKAALTWNVAPNVIGGVTYTVLIDGRVRTRGLTTEAWTPPAGSIGNGIHAVQVLATDSAGEETLSPVAQLQIDAAPPRVRLVRHGADRITVRVTDAETGARAPGTTVRFGDGTRPVRGRLAVTHRYTARGLYLITVRCADQLGNAATYHLWVRAR